MGVFPDPSSSPFPTPLTPPASTDPALAQLYQNNFAQTLPASTAPTSYSSDAPPADFVQAVVMALWRIGVNANAVQGQIPQLALQLWQEPFVQGYYQSQANQEVIDPTTGSPLPSVVTVIETELTDPHNSHYLPVTIQGLSMLQQSGVQLNSTQLQYSNYSPGMGDPSIMNAIAQAAQEYGIPYNLAVATAMVESGLNPKAVGDRGCAYGLFQLNACTGEGIGMSLQELYDPLTNARRALSEFAQVRASDPSVVNDPGRWAALAQRPSDPTGYANNVNNLLKSGLGAAPYLSGMSASDIIPRPFDGNYPITQDYGENGEVGIDYGLNYGTPVYTPFAGTIQVEDRGKQDWGLRVFVLLDNGYTFAIGHMASVSVSPGQRVNPGQLLGESGGIGPHSGESTGPHIEVQWISPGHQFLNPHSIMDPILTGTATYGQLGLTSAEGSGVSAADARARLEGIDPELIAKYPAVDQEFQKYFGRHPTASEMLDILAHGSDAISVDAYLDTFPSPIKGIPMGMYQTIYSNLNSVMQNLFGHPGTLGMVKELYDLGYTSTSEIELWLLNMDAQGKLDPNTYNKLFQLNSSYLQNIYNDPGFDPRIALAQYGSITHQGATGQPILASSGFVAPPPGTARPAPAAGEYWASGADRRYAQDVEPH